MSDPIESGDTTQQTSGTGDNENTQAAGTQTANANLENANIPPGELWQGNPLYFQTGKKAGQLKPAARDKPPREAGGVDAGKFQGLNVSALKRTESTDQSAPTNAEIKKAEKAEKKANEARIGAAMAMRLLDVITGFISGGTYGKNFTKEEAETRNKYREDLERDWQLYLETLDIPMHPALVVAFGSAMYIAPAFSTEKGAQKAASWKEKIGGKIFARFF